MHDIYPLLRRILPERLLLFSLSEIIALFRTQAADRQKPFSVLSAAIVRQTRGAAVLRDIFFSRFWSILSRRSDR